MIISSFTASRAWYLYRYKHLHAGWRRLFSSRWVKHNFFLLVFAFNESVRWKLQYVLKRYKTIKPFKISRIFHLATYNKVRMVHYIYWRVTGYNFPQNFIFLLPNIYFVLPNSGDLDKMPHYAAFHLGLHCLTKYPVLELLVSKRLSMNHT